MRSAQEIVYNSVFSSNSLKLLAAKRDVEVKDASTNTSSSISSSKGKSLSSEHPSDQKKLENNKRITYLDIKSTRAEDHQVSKKQRTNNESSKHLQRNQPPMILPNIHAKVSKEQRQKVLTKFFEEFKRIYRPLLGNRPLLAHEHALLQEEKMHDSAHPSNYVNSSVNILKRLRSRVESTGPDDVGIDGDWVQPYIPSDFASESLMTLLSDYRVKVDQLKELGFPVSDHVSIPLDIEGVLNSSKPCCRCNQSFSIQKTAVGQDDIQCKFHTGYLYYKRNLGWSVLSFSSLSSSPFST